MAWLRPIKPRKIQRQWDFIKNYQVDFQYPGVYEMIGVDGKPAMDDKGRIWKVAYYEGRAWMNVTESLKRLAEKGVQ
jgi:cellobiose epimerase